MVRRRDFEPRLTVDLMLKDLRLLGQLAASTGTPTTVTAATEQLYTAAASMGLGSLDRAAIVLLVERLAGLESLS
jgi:3-hydroxyisobutyrate dehydrogenase-like beta-hydroxyacid dehydrogenase